MNIAIHTSTTSLQPLGEGYRTVITIHVGTHVLNVVGHGASEKGAQEAAEHSFIAACADLDQLSEIRRRTGGVRWGALAAVTP
jgi:hypothetical protein